MATHRILRTLPVAGDSPLVCAWQAHSTHTVQGLPSFSPSSSSLSSSSLLHHFIQKAPGSQAAKPDQDSYRQIHREREYSEGSEFEVNK